MGLGAGMGYIFHDIHLQTLYRRIRSSSFLGTETDMKLQFSIALLALALAMALAKPNPKASLYVP